MGLARWARRIGVAALGAGALAGGCTREQAAVAPAPPAAVDPATTRSPTALPATAALVRREWEARIDPADGQGDVQLEDAGADGLSVAQGETRDFHLRYTAVGTGIAVGGSLEVRVPFAFGWSPPQLAHPGALGFVKVETAAAGVTLTPSISPEATPRPMVRIGIGGRPLARAEQILVTYTSGADTLAERGEAFWISVDGDGDGVAAPLAHGATLTIRPGPAAQLVAFWPSTAHPGDRVRLSVAALDATASVAAMPAEPLEVALPAGIEGSAQLSPHGSSLVSDYVPRAEGVYELTVRAPRAGFSARTNPLVVTRDGPRIVWGDVHGHSNVSDGTGLPADYFRYARDVSAVDVSALTDHDHWGPPRRLDADPEAWAEIKRQVREFHEPERFVTLLGYEWTSWLHGHRHVLFFADDGPVLSSADPRYETPTQLWAGLRGLPALTFAHHPAGGPIATNWAFAPDPVLEPLVEIVSVAGSSEAPDTPRPVKSTVPGNFVRDALGRGYRLGFVGSGDAHDGHPGCPLARGCGLVGIQTESLTREDVLAALRARRTYAVNGPRIVLDVRLDGAPIGAVVAPAASRTLAIRVDAPSPIAKIDLVRDGAVAESIDCERRREVALERTVRDLAKGDSLYVRVVQIDDGAAWSSPYFVE